MLGAVFFAAQFFFFSSDCFHSKLSAGCMRISLDALGRQEGPPGFSMQPFTTTRVSIPTVIQLLRLE